MTEQDEEWDPIWWSAYWKRYDRVLAMDIDRLRACKNIIRYYRQMGVRSHPSDHVLEDIERVLAIKESPLFKP